MEVLAAVALVRAVVEVLAEASAAAALVAEVPVAVGNSRKLINIQPRNAGLNIYITMVVYIS